MARWLIVLAACGLTLAAAMAVAQECPEIVAILPYGEADVVAVEGSYAYLGIGRGLLVVDQSDPTDLRSAARLAMPGTVRGIAVAGGRAYVTLGEDGVRVVDVSDPTDPRIVQAVDTPGEAQGVKEVGDLLFVASGSAGLCAVSPAADPPLLGCVDTQQDARDVDVNGVLAIVADGPGGLVAVNAADPAHMTVLGTAAMEARAVKAQGDLAFVAAGQAGLRVVDVSNPSSPVQVGQVDPGSGGHLDAAGSLVLLMGTDSYMDVTLIDVSTPTNPVVVGVSPGGGQVAVSGSYATVTGPLSVIDISQPTMPSVVGELRLGVVQEVAVSGALAILNEYEGVRVVDVSTPDRPRELSTIDLTTVVEGFALDRTWLYLAGSTASVREILVLDLSDPTRPVQIGAHRLPYNFYSIAAVGELVHYTDHYGLHILDVSDHTTPAQVGFVPGPTTQSDLSEVVAVPGYAYPCWGGSTWGSTWGECGIVDVTDPHQPQWLDTFRTAGYWDLRVDEHLLLAPGVTGGMGWTSTRTSIHDVSIPCEPALLGDRMLFSGWYDWIQTSVASHGGLLFVSSSTFGVVRVIGLRTLNDPDAPDLAQATLPAPAGMAPMGRFLLVADTELGLVVLDTTCVGGMFADGFEAGNTGAWSEAWP